MAFVKLQPELNVTIEVENINFGVADWSFQNVDAAFNNCSMEQLKITVEGGSNEDGLAVKNSDIGQIEIKNTRSASIDECVFNDNGLSDSASLVVTRSGLKIRNSTAKSFMGDTFLHVISGEVLFEESLFINLTVSALLLEVVNHSSVTLNNCKFLRNSGSLVSASDTSSVVIHQSVFELNNGSGRNSSEAPDFVVMSGANASLLVTDSSFIENTNFSSGVISIQNSSYAVVQDSRFENNKGVRGAISAKTLSRLQITNCSFQRNMAETGGAVFVEFCGKLSITDAAFVQNTAEKEGGAVFIAHSDNNTTLTIDNSNFTANSARQGGALFARNISFGLRQTVFVDNSAPGDSLLDPNFGGAVGFERANLTTTDCIFEGNTAYFSGGAIHGTFGQLVIESTHFANNFVLHEQAGTCGTIRVSQCPLTIQKSRFENSRAFVAGAVCNEDNDDTFIQDSLFQNNSAESSGALTCHSGKIINTTFLQNAAFTEGGAISVLPNSKLEVAHSLFESNVAQFAGGAIYTRPNVTLSCNFCSFTGNIVR